MVTIIQNIQIVELIKYKYLKKDVNHYLDIVYFDPICYHNEEETVKGRKLVNKKSVNFSFFLNKRIRTIIFFWMEKKTINNNETIITLWSRIQKRKRIKKGQCASRYYSIYISMKLRKMSKRRHGTALFRQSSSTRS